MLPAATMAWVPPGEEFFVADDVARAISVGSYEAGVHIIYGPADDRGRRVLEGKYSGNVPLVA